MSIGQVVLVDYEILNISSFVARIPYRTVEFLEVYYTKQAVESRVESIMRFWVRILGRAKKCYWGFLNMEMLNKSSEFGSWVRSYRASKRSDAWHNHLIGLWEWGNWKCTYGCAHICAVQYLLRSWLVWLSAQTDCRVRN